MCVKHSYSDIIKVDWNFYLRTCLSHQMVKYSKSEQAKFNSYIVPLQSTIYFSTFRDCLFFIKYTYDFSHDILLSWNTLACFPYAKFLIILRFCSNVILIKKWLLHDNWHKIILLFFFKMYFPLLAFYNTVYIKNNSKYCYYQRSIMYWIRTRALKTDRFEYKP